jgi:hypothetical protein
MLFYRYLFFIFCLTHIYFCYKYLLYSTGSRYPPSPQQQFIIFDFTIVCFLFHCCILFIFNFVALFHLILLVLGAYFNLIDYIFI